MFLQQEYCNLVNDALTRNETIILGGNCSVRYSGRAESFLDRGDRIILIKNDKTLIVHQPTGTAPINYMKPNSSHNLSIENSKLILKSQNLLLKECIDIIFNKIYFFNSYKLEDGETIVISGTEDDMAKMIIESPETIEEGFKPVGKEEQTKYGFIDVLGIDKNGILVIVECKRYTADLSAVTQLRRYVEKIMESKGIKEARGILAAPRISPNAEKMLTDWGFSFKQVNPPKYLEEFDRKQQKLNSFL